ncbi:MAG: hypothetical protein ACJAYU_004253 [Bradymonadia bacterium]|jgi:hypothetical protein
MPRALLILIVAAALSFSPDVIGQPEVAALSPIRVPGELAGRWVLVQTTTTVSRVVSIGRVRTTTRAVMFYDLEDDGSSLNGHGTLCEVDVQTGSPFVYTELPSALVRVLNAPVLSASVDAAGTFLQPRSYSVLGVELDDPRVDELPQEPDDPRVIDCDGDGNPGGTVRISGIVSGEVYVAQRSWSELEGRVTSPDTIEGQVRFDEDQVILGASRRILRSGPPTEPDDDPERNWFRLVRLADGADCVDALAYAESLED